MTKPATVDPAAQARQAEVRQHVARGAELAKKGQYAEAEQEYRAALLLDSQNADLYVSLGLCPGSAEEVGRCRVRSPRGAALEPQQ